MLKLRRRWEVGSLPISEQARQYLRTQRAISVPLPLTPRVVRAVRAMVSRQEAPTLARLCDTLVAGISRDRCGEVEVVTVVPRSAAPDITDYCLYIHGGAYIFGEPVDAMAVLMADELRRPVVSIGYSLAPEAQYPVALNECISAYRAVSTQRDGNFAVIGVSAGAALTLSMMQTVAAEPNLRRPQAMALLAPWADLTRTGDSYFANEGRDPLIRWRRQLDKAVRIYVGGVAANDQRVSPVYSETWADLPPTVIVTGTRDLFLSNAVRTYWTLRNAGTPTDLRVWEGMWHLFFEQPDLPEAQHARREVAQFLNTRNL